MNVLISGGAGFIGSWLTGELINEENHYVIVIDNMTTGSYENIRHLKKYDIEVFNDDVTDTDLPLEFSTYDLDCIIHLASPCSPWDFVTQPVRILDANTLGTKNMLEIARKSDAKFLYCSTSEIYGDPEVLPTPETYWGNVNPIGIRGCYDVGKRAGEAYTMAYIRRYGLDGRIARIFNTFGEGMPDDGRVLVNFIKQATNGEPITIYGDGTHTRSFMYIKDLISGLIKLMNADSSDVCGVPVNLGNTKEITIHDLARWVCDFCQVPFNIIHKSLPPDDPKRRIPDISRAKKILEWEPIYPLEYGLKRTINWWRYDRKN